MNKSIQYLSIISTVLFLTACSNPTEPVNSERVIVGTITDINSSSKQLGILVEEDPSVYGPEKKNGGKILFSISEETEIYKESKSKSLIKIDSKYLKIGMKVEGWTAAPVLMSYPAQAGAVKIIVINN